MHKEDKPSFILYHNFANQFALLSMEERGQLITALFEYSQTQSIETELSPLANMAFSCMKDALDRDRESYAERCRQNAENGKKGGRPRKSFSAPKIERFFEEPKKADKDKEKDNGNDNENDLDIGNGMGTEEGKGYGEGKEIKDSSAEASRAVPSCGSARPALSEEEQEELFRKGIPKEYTEARAERAAAYAAAHQKSRVAVLAEWWKGDRGRPNWNHVKARYAETERERTEKSHTEKDGFSTSSFDEEDFFQAAMQRSLLGLG